jgi:hypothetical protein
MGVTYMVSKHGFAFGICCLSKSLMLIVFVFMCMSVDKSFAWLFCSLILILFF